MSFKRACVYDGGIEQEMRNGMGYLANARISTNASDGNQTITAAMMMGGVAMFTGAAGAVNYTTDTAANILAALGNMDIGDCFHFRLVNTAAQTATIVAGIGVTLAGFTTVNAGSRECIVEKTSATTVTITSI